VVEVCGMMQVVGGASSIEHLVGNTSHVPYKF
jgi:hypothetical protein